MPATQPIPAALQQKLDQAYIVIEEAFDTFSPASTLVAWSAGKDSTLVLRLVLDVCQRTGLPFPRALDIDQDDQFPQLIAFRDKVAADWGVELAVVRNNDFLDRVTTPGDTVTVTQLSAANQFALATFGNSSPSVQWIPDSPICTHLLKTLPINEHLSTNSIQGLFTGIRWDEHLSRADETYFRVREEPPHTRINPILHFTERDIWETIFSLKIPYCDLYKEGYRSIGTKSGTKKTSTLPAWEQDLENTTERGGRSAEKEQIMRQLRALGYM